MRMSELEQRELHIKRRQEARERTAARLLRLENGQSRLYASRGGGKRELTAEAAALARQSIVDLDKTIAEETRHCARLRGEPLSA